MSRSVGGVCSLAGLAGYIVSWLRLGDGYRECTWLSGTSLLVLGLGLAMLFAGAIGKQRREVRTKRHREPRAKEESLARMGSDTEKLIHFHGALAAKGDKRARFAAAIRFDRWDPTSLTVDLLWNGDQDERRLGAGTLELIQENHVLLESDDPNQHSVEVLGISGMSHTYDPQSAQSSSIDAAAVQMGITTDALEEDTRYSVSVRLQPSGILCLPGHRQSSYTGEVRVKKILEGKVEVPSAFGTLEPQESYEFHSSTEAGNRVEHRVQRATIMGSVVIPSGQSLHDAHETMKTEFAEICTALSLCYRQPVNYYEVCYLPREGKGWGSERTMRRRWGSVTKRQQLEELINVRQLIDGGLARLVAAIRESRESVGIARAIKFLSASYDARLETAYFMAFSAMETVVNACLEKDEKEPLSRGAYDKLRRHLSTALDGFAFESETVRALIKEKLPELKRPSFARCVAAACERHPIETSDLWPQGGFAHGMNRAARNRNALFHSATADELHVMAGDLVRIRTFTERVLLHMLGWPPDGLWRWYDQNLKWLNRGE